MLSIYIFILSTVKGKLGYLCNRNRDKMQRSRKSPVRGKKRELSCHINLALKMSKRFQYIRKRGRAFLHKGRV